MKKTLSTLLPVVVLSTAMACAHATKNNAKSKIPANITAQFQREYPNAK